MNQVEDQNKSSNKPDKECTFEVDGEKVTTDQRELKVREILELSSNTPVEQYQLREVRGQSEQEKIYMSLDETVKLHPNQQFAAVFMGETPYS